MDESYYEICEIGNKLTGDNPRVTRWNDFGDALEALCTLTEIATNKIGGDTFVRFTLTNVIKVEIAGQKTHVIRNVVKDITVLEL